MNSRIHLGHVSHRRHVPKDHQFRYPVYAYALDLDELPELDRRLPGFGHNRLRPVSLHDADYLHPGGGPIKERLLDMLTQAGRSVDDVGRVILVTSARFFHYVFNPVSFYYVFDRAGTLAHAVAEVNNTYGEKHVYLLDPAGENAPQGFPAQFGAKKAFHVSPFMDLSGDYRFSLADIRQRLDIKVDLVKAGRTVFEARLAGERAMEFTAANLARTLARRPVAAALTYPRILWEALRLSAKKLPALAKPQPISPATIRRLAVREGPAQRTCHRLISRFARQATRGSLTMTAPDGTSETFGDGQPGHAAHIRVHDPRFYTRTALGGDIGLGEAYTLGWWDAPHANDAATPGDGLLEVFGFFLDNREQMKIASALGLPEALVTRLSGLRRLGGAPNDRQGARDNIHAHYDLSNELYAAFLDPSMSYSSAVFGHEGEALEAAQRRKNRLLMDKAGIGPGSRVLEIGCGWGGFATQAASERGCHVTGLTLSERQHAYATELVRRQGLTDQVDIRLMDYRDVEGRYDAVVSVEMLEAVGHDYHADYFQALERLLAPGAVAALQVITILDQRYEAYRQGGDWVRKHIFPGGLAPSLTRLATVMTAHTKLVIQDAENIGPHYVRTLRLWRERFEAAWPDIEPLGFDEAFRRTWRYYLTTCESGFAKGFLGDMQLVVSRPEDACLACRGISS